MHYFVFILVFAIILKRKRKLVALLLLSYICIVTINVLWLFLAVPWVGLQCVTVVFLDHTHFLLLERFKQFLTLQTFIYLSSGLSSLHLTRISLVSAV